MVREKGKYMCADVGRWRDLGHCGTKESCGEVSWIDHEHFVVLVVGMNFINSEVSLLQVLY